MTTNPTSGDRGSDRGGVMPDPRPMVPLTEHTVGLRLT